MGTPLVNIGISESGEKHRALVRKVMTEQNLSYDRARIAVNNSAEGQSLLARMKKPEGAAVSNQVLKLPNALVQKLQRSLSMYSTTTSVENVNELVGLLTEALKALDAKNSRA